MYVTGILPGGLCVRYSVRIVIVVRVKYSDDPNIPGNTWSFAGLWRMCCWVAGTRGVLILVRNSTFYKVFTGGLSSVNMTRTSHV